MCMECGAPDNECETRFHECLAKEFEDLAYGRVHNLTVSTYMLQHSSKLTAEGWLYERDLLREFLLDNMSAEMIRKNSKDLLEDGKRTFKIKSRDGLPVIPVTRWTKTVLDVRLEDPASYCADVTAWAMAALGDSEDIRIGNRRGDQ